MDDKRLMYIWLSLLPGWGCVSVNKLLKQCGGIENCLDISAEELLIRDVKGGKDSGSKCLIGKKRIDSFIRYREENVSSEGIFDNARMIMEQCEQKGINIITAEDEQYPLRFMGLGDMPVVFYVKGFLNINNYSRSVGIVGARRCTPDGKLKSIDTAIREVSVDSVIISGMAKGVDSYAHTAALKKKGYTVAVLGNGVDICYPKEHMKLYEKLTRQGCILSEYPPGTPPREYMFPKRNRIIAALSDVLYVIDAGRNSGTVSTVENAKKYFRKVEMF
ncbi:MAG: DNA-protecting protein DprA [Lachnospiraceae bacterium]|nr:DNA-protecting protein DprA [Lachnospiraceae bacterium]